MQDHLMISILLASNTAVTCLLVRTLFDEMHAIKWCTASCVFTIFGYILSSAVLLSLDRFTIVEALIVELAGAILWLGIKLILAAKHGIKPFYAVNWDFRGQGIPVLLAVLALLISSNNFGFFGMGQDQGVYQVKAIDLMYGKTEKVYHFREYDLLEGEAEKKTFQESISRKLRGLDIIDETRRENEIRTLLTGESIDQFNLTDAIYHGIATYPALLALWGSVSGFGRIAGIQTLLYALTVLVIWYTAENMRLKKLVSLLISAIYLLSPQALWLSKSTLTETLLALIIAVFLYLLSEPKKTGRRWWSAWMVTMFSVVHVSIYVMIPMFLVLYYFLYLWSEDRRYLRAAAISAISFMLGYTFMIISSPRYTLGNTQRICYGPISKGNVYFVLMGAGLVGLLLAICLRWLKAGKRMRGALNSKGFAWAFRTVVAALLAMSFALTLKKGLSTQQYWKALTTNGLYDMVWMTGIVSLPVTVVCAMIEPKRLFTREFNLGVTFIFGYSVLLMCCVLKSDIKYCYYYSRYLTPYIPVVCVMAGIVWNHYSSKSICAALALSVAVSLPFDYALINSKDDTVSSYDAIERIAQACGQDGDAVVFGCLEDNSSDAFKAFYLPVRAMTSADCFFSEEDLDGQLRRLSERYDRVFYVSTMDADYDVVTRINEVVLQDDNVSHRLRFCPFPLQFNRSERVYTVYSFGDILKFNGDTLPTKGGSTVDGDLVLKTGQLQYGPYVSLGPGTYRVKYVGKNLDKARFKATADKGVRKLNITNVNKTESELTYEFQLDTRTDYVEYVVSNDEETTVTIRYITLRKVS